MTRVYGRHLSEASRYIGSLAQLAAIDSLVTEDGPGRGARLVQLNNGGGLEIDLYPDRCLDIGQVRYRGVPIAWMAPDGVQPPDQYDPADFLRSFGGGLLATCGLDTFGGAGDDNGEWLPVHGRVGAQRARMESTVVTDEALVVTAAIRQSRFGGENLVVHRRFESPIGSSVIRLTDTVTNASARSQPHMILYHVNFGWPLLSESSFVDVDASRVVGIDHRAALEAEEWSRIGPPTAGYQGRVYRHDLRPIPTARARLTNPDLGMAVSLAIGAETLPHLFEWKMLAEGEYLLGLEPANCDTMAGRADARSRGTLPMLQAGESVTYHLEWDFDPDASSGLE